MAESKTMNKEELSVILKEREGCKVEFTENYFYVTFKQSHGYLKMAQEQTHQKTPLYLTRLEQEIFDVVGKNPSVTQKKIAHQLKISSETVKEYISKLKSKGVLRRVGLDKGGHWEVIQ